MTTRFKPPLFMMVLAAITLILSSYDLYDLAHVNGRMPVVLALVAVGGADVFAVACGKHALTVASDGDSPFLWNVMVIVAAIASAWMQYERAVINAFPVAVGVLMAMFPIATVILFEGALRRAARINGRIDGRVARPRATFELLQWLIFRKATWAAFRRSIADRSLDSDGAFKLGLLESQPIPMPEVPRRTIELNYDAILGNPLNGVSGRAIERSSEHPSERAHEEYEHRTLGHQGASDAREVHENGTSEHSSTDDSDSSNIAPPATIAQAVRLAIPRVGRDINALHAEVESMMGREVKKDTVRLTARKIPAVRSVEGTVNGGYL
jgi:hypothetical protein